MAIHHSFKISKKKTTSQSKSKATLRLKSEEPVVSFTDSPIIAAFDVDLSNDGPTADFQWNAEAIEKSRIVFPLAPETWETTFAAAQESDTTQVSQSTSEEDTTLEHSEEEVGPKKVYTLIPGWNMDGGEVGSPFGPTKTPLKRLCWIECFFKAQSLTEYEPINYSKNFKEKLNVTQELYTPGSVTNPITDGYVVSGKYTHAFFNPITGAMTPWIHQPAPRAVKDKVTNTTLRTILNSDCLNVGDPSYWWNVRVNSNYIHLSEVSQNRVVAALFNTGIGDTFTGPTEICVIRCFTPYTKEASHTSQFYSFQPQQKEKYKLALAGNPKTNLFLVESYKEDNHYIYLLTNSLTSSLPHYKLVVEVCGITRSKWWSNVTGKKWWRHRIFTFGDNMAIFKEGRLTVWWLTYSVETESIVAHLIPNRYGFVADVHPVQFGKYLIFPRGVLDMSTFWFRTVPISQNGRKKIIWHMRDGELIGSTVNNLSFQCFYLGYSSDS
ncbi:hypothetical protein CJU90_2242 [Yarrowia sp. C11]|nr:hypothetical protein CKK34_6270 [Yarrowia sp. E02]KAG5372161.1 hypothetical protein CJU90_2242 [Yarrowia sp. C11]